MLIAFRLFAFLCVFVFLFLQRFFLYLVDKSSSRTVNSIGSDHLQKNWGQEKNHDEFRCTFTTVTVLSIAIIWYSEIELDHNTAELSRSQEQVLDRE